MLVHHWLGASTGGEAGRGIAAARADFGTKISGAGVNNGFLISMRLWPFFHKLFGSAKGLPTHSSSCCAGFRLH